MEINMKIIRNERLVIWVEFRGEMSFNWNKWRVHDTSSCGSIGWLLENKSKWEQSENGEGKSGRAAILLEKVSVGGFPWLTREDKRDKTWARVDHH